ncbi:response regulator [Acidicapsa dinghuensis]|uniref:Response regulator n=1 Tax=Acidicapsa dinghuensis TaxID=2218256 RepID=A0ABW1EA68_9BACT|nr:response regulator [Acidicapsa dinghuensis]
MTTELTQPPSEAGQAQASAPGQSQEHRRRRRRRRKTKSNPAAQNQPQNQNGQQVSASPAQPPIQQNQPRPQQQGGQQQGQGASGRKKKKKHGGGGFQGSPGNNANPGNSINGHGGGKKRQQKGPRQFVGPMDHSYRGANGNVADSPPSTIPVHGNGNIGGYYSDLQNVRIAAPPIAADKPPRIYFFVEDLFFVAKIQEVSRKLGVKVEFVKGDGKDALVRITDAPENERPGLLVFDLNSNTAKPLTLIPKVRTKLKKSVSIIGFLSHLQGDLKLKATEAGCDTVMPRSAFSQSLPNLIMRYGLEEDEDNYPQPV